jgi:outer membrane biosynthesis protein TonB
MFQEFQLSVTPLKEPGQYLVRTEIVAPGVPLAEEQVSWPVQDWLEQAQQLMNDPLTHLLQGNGRLQDNRLLLSNLSGNTPASLFNLGRQLYEGLFQGSLRDSLIIAQGIAEAHKAVLRLRLGLKGSLLPRLPWEALYIGETKDNPLGCRPLVTGTDIIFSRYQFNSFFNHLTGLSQPTASKFLRILMVIASPNDQESLELKQEAYHLQQELHNNTKFPPIELDILEQPGREELTQALEQGQYQIFHYAGHSNIGDSGGNLYLVNPYTGLTEIFYGDDLAGLLANNSIKLAIFNSCYGGDTVFDSDQDLESNSKRNLAQAMVGRGIKGVLAMSSQIPDRVALTLTRLLYRYINQGYPIDLSLSRARQGLIATYGSDQLYWALPILYLDPKFDGILIIRDSFPHSLTDLEDDDPSVLTPEEKVLLLSPQPLKTSAFLEQAEQIEEQIKANYEHHDGSEDEKIIQDLLNDLLTTESNLKDILDNLSESETVTKNPSPPVEETKPIPQKTIIPIEETKLITEVEPPDHQKPKNNIKRTKKGKKNKFSRYRIPLTFGIFTVVAGVGFWLFNQTLLSQKFNQDAEIANSERPGLVSPQNNNHNDDGILAKAQTAMVTEIAIEQFTQGNLTIAQPAVETLLDRGALPHAKAALESVPTANIDDPEICFLKGRLAWQFAKSGNKDYDILDARRYWEITVKSHRDSITFLNALGFAYYTEGKINLANQVWYDALDLVKESNLDTPEILHAYAGLALGLRRLADQSSGRQKEILINQALGYRHQVMTQDPINFQPDNLVKNWLWSEKAIDDWKNFLSPQTTQS